MVRYITRRLIGFVVTVWAVVTAVFLLFRLVPGDPAQLIAGTDASQSSVNAIRAELGLDAPLYRQYLHYMGGLFHGDLGHSVVFGSGLSSALFSRMPVTVELAFEAMLLSAVVGIALGLLSAVRSGTFVDRALGVLLTGFGGVPAFWLGLMLIAVFASWLHLVPVTGGGGLSGDALPVVTLAAYPIAVIARLVRASSIEAMGSGFVLAAEARGVHRSTILVRHVLRNALVPALTMVGLLLGYLLGGSIVVEDIFTKQGIGLLLLNSVSFHDYEMVQAIAIVFSLMFLVVNLMVDLLYGMLDPRVRPAGRSL
ncbi:MAG: ABC transporter permease [Acidimicrobiales bacterium]